MNRTCACKVNIASTPFTLVRVLYRLNALNTVPTGLCNSHRLSCDAIASLILRLLLSIVIMLHFEFHAAPIRVVTSLSGIVDSRSRQEEGLESCTAQNPLMSSRPFGHLYCKKNRRSVFDWRVVNDFSYPWKCRVRLFRIQRSAEDVRIYERAYVR